MKLRLILLGSIAIGSLVCSPDLLRARETMNLDGTWHFATDPQNRGESEKWYQPSAKLPAMPLPGYAPTANGKIQVPGIWDNQGYGAETQKVHHNFVGKGWYKREVEIPSSWSGQHVFLTVGGACRYAKAWVDGQFLGEHIGALTPFDFDITKYVSPGKKATITIQVDSKQRWEVDSMNGCLFLADDIETPWGGLWSHVALEARADAWLSDLYIRPDVTKSNCSASATFNGKVAAADEAKLEVFDKSGQCVAKATSKLDANTAAGQPVSVSASIPDAKLWTPDSPTLYTARLRLLKDGQSLDAVETRFGMRQFTTDGYRLLLNGKRIMLRGYGDDHVYLKEMAMPSDKELHLKRLRTIKSYGFNHVRHHSTMMPPEYYDACDEVGIISTAEFTICYAPWLPGTGEVWKKNVPPGTDPQPAMETYRREFAGAIQRHRNHPSIISWVMGNELWNAVDLQRDFRKIARQNDPSRFFLDADGVDLNIMEPGHDRDTLDYYAAQFDDRGDPFEAKKFKTPKPGKPVISHEAGNYVTFSRPDLADQFKDNIKPWWLGKSKAKLEELGLLGEADQWVRNSEQLYLLCHKFNVEGLRKNPYLSGYHWWLFQDYWTSSNGLFDHSFRPKSIKPEEVRQFNNDVVLLLNGLERTYAAGGTPDVKLLVSNFSPEALQGAAVSCIVTGAGPLGGAESDGLSVAQGEVDRAGDIKLALPQVSSPTKVQITAELVNGVTKYTNHWSTWVYPAATKPEKLDLPVFADKAQIAKYPGWDLKPIPAEGPLPEKAVYLTSRLADRRLVDVLERGACLVLVDSEDIGLNPRPITMKTTWWKGTYENQVNHTGTLVYDNPVTKGMAPNGWCDDGWFYLLEGALKYNFEGCPTRPDVLIRALPSFDPVEDEAILFEAGVGKGCLIVDGLNHHRAGGRPENAWLMARLLEHAATLPQPKAKWPVSFLATASTKAAAGVPGFQRLLKNEGREDAWTSYWDDKAPVYVLEQQKKNARIAWETAAVPSQVPGEKVVFVFAGGLGNREAHGHGFMLEVDGKDVLRFDLPAPWDIPRWQSADKQMELRFVTVRNTQDGDPMGIFYLTVPKERLEAGKPCRLAVRSLGDGCPRWFALNPYPDVN